MIAEWAFVGLSTKPQGKVAQATSLANLCWATQEAIQNGLDHIGAKIDNIGDYLVNLVNKIETFIPLKRLITLLSMRADSYSVLKYPVPGNPKQYFSDIQLGFFKGNAKE